MSASPSQVKGSRSWWIPERAFVALYLVFESFTLIAYLESGSPSRFYVLFFIARIVFVAAAWVVSGMRLAPGLAIPIVSEMPTRVYWRCVLCLLIAMKLFVLDQFVFWVPQIAGWGPFLGAVIVSSLLLDLQQRPWSYPTLDGLAASARKLVSMSEDDLGILSSELNDRSEEIRNRSLVWRLFKVVGIVVVGALLEMAAEYVLLLANEAGVTFPRLIPGS